MEIIKLKSIKKINAPSKRYELTVKDNHNFFCNGILKHNCTVIPVFGKRGFIVKKTVVVGAYVCSRNNAYKVPDNSIFWDMMRKYDIVGKMKELWKTEHKAVILQGEQVGPGIQNNIYDFKQNHWYLFAAKDYESLKQVTYEEQVKIADKFGMRTVPLLWTGKLNEIMPNIDAAVSFAEKASWEPIDGDKIHSWLNLEDKGKLWTDFMQHEGIVVRTSSFDKDNNIGVSFKVKNLPYAERGLGKIHNDCINYKQSAKA